MKHLTLIPINEPNLMLANVLEIVRGGAMITCKPNECGTNTGTCNENHCMEHSGSCTINNCNVNRGGSVCSTDSCDIHNPPKPCKILWSGCPSDSLV